MITLYPGAIPNSKPCNKTEHEPAPGRLEGITVPALYMYQPAVKDSSRTAMIICPGSGYRRLAISHEGHQVAEAFNKKGVTAFVLKYRNPIDSDCVVNKEWVAQQDAQQAIKIIRERAAEFGINPNLIGMMDFSAGGYLTSTIATHFKTARIENTKNTRLRPDFFILAYPVISFTDSLAHKGSRNNMLGKNAAEEKIILYSNERQVTVQTPPAFIIHAADDKTVKVQNSLLFYEALLQHGVPAELHIPQKGGHGFGLHNKMEPVDWLPNLFAWMATNGFIKGNVP